jgi:hypothetical protein
VSSPDLAAEPFETVGASTVHGWLPLAVPANASRVATDEEELARTLSAAGYDVGETPADVEIVRDPARFRGSPHVAVPIVAFPPDRPSLLGAALDRVRTSVRSRLATARTVRRFRSRGVRSVAVIRWDFEASLRRSGAGRSPAARTLPRAAVVVGTTDGRPGATVFDAVVRAAAGRCGLEEQTLGAPSVTGSGSIVCVGAAHVLRVAVGPAADQLVAQERALGRLPDRLPAEVVERIPAIVGSGREGHAHWSLERRLAGTPPARLDDAVMADCVDFLVELNRRSPAGPGERIDAVGRQAAALLPSHAGALLDLTDRLRQGLERCPGVFSHGDFWRENILVVDGRVSGVIDWERAGPARLPALDLIHLRVAEAERRRRRFGHVVAADLDGWAATTGDRWLRSYCERLEIDLSPALVRLLLSAYWLDRVASELVRYRDRAARPGWIETNVELVLGRLARSA